MNIKKKAVTIYAHKKERKEKGKKKSYWFWWLKN